jgi:hypothetical protein
MILYEYHIQIRVYEVSATYSRILEACVHVDKHTSY